MSWFKVDDSFWGHPKVLRIPRKQRPAAIGLWCLAGSWCAQQLTDGALDAAMVDEFGATKAQAAELVRVGLWLETEAGYRFHDWEAWQPTRVQVHERRDAEAKRKASWRDAKRAKASQDAPVPAGHQRDTTVASGGTDAVVPDVSSLPDPTRPDPTRPSTSRTSSSADADAAFEAFWKPYPRKVGKQSARKVWDRKVKTTDAAVITAGVMRYLPIWEHTEPDYIPHPATWLQRGSWEDEITPPHESPEDRMLREAREARRAAS